MNMNRFSSSAGYALTLVALTNALSLLDRNILAILAPRIKKDLVIGDAEMGLLYGTVFALFYALFSLPLGRMADTWIRTRLLSIALAFWSVATGLAGMAQGFTVLALSRLGVGIGEGVAGPGGTSLVFDHYPKPRRGFAMAVIAAAIALGLGGSSILGGVAADWWDHLFTSGDAPFGLRGWQFAFVLAAVPGFIVSVLLWRMPEPVRGRLDGIPSKSTDRPLLESLRLLASVTPVSNWMALLARRANRSHWAANLGFTLLIVIAAIALTTLTSSLSPRPPLHIGDWAINPHALQWGVVAFGVAVVFNLYQTLKLSDPVTHAVLTTSPSLILCMAIGSLQTMINYGIMGFTPSFLMKTFHLSPATTGLQFGLLSAGIGILGPMIAGPLSDRLHARLPGAGRVVVTLFSLAVSPLLALWVYSAHTPADFYGRFVVYSVVLTGWLPPLYAIMFDQVLPRMRGITSSTYVILSTIFGLGIGPFLVGMVSDAMGGNLAYAILSINWVAPAIVAMLVLLALRVKRDEASLLARAQAAGEPV
jgi:MFS family permease